MQSPVGFTLSELTEKTGRTEASIRSLLSRHKIKPLSYEAIYPPEALELITSAKRGRPAKKPVSPGPPPADN